MAELALSDDTPPVRIDTKTVLSGGGSAVCETNRYTISNGDDFLFGLLDSMLEDTALSAAVAKNRQWVVVKATTELGCEAVADLLFKFKMVGGVAKLGNRVMMLIKKNRSSINCLDVLPDSQVFPFLHTPTNNGTSQAEGMKVFRSFLRTGRDVVVNYIILDHEEHPQSDMHAVIEALKESSKHMSCDAFETELMRAKMVNSKVRSAEESCLIINWASLQKFRARYEASLQASALMRRSALNTALRVFKDEPLFMGLEVWGVDFDTWSVFKMPLSSFVRTGLYSKYSLVLLGPPRTAKTPCAESLAALLALAEQSPAHEVPEDERKEPYYLKVGTVESLKKVSEHLVANVPLVFDDVAPSELRGTRPCMSWNEVKHLTYVTKTKEGSEALDARNDDIVFPPNCPRIFTSNKLKPSDWCKGLLDVSAFSPEGVMASLRWNTAYVESAAVYKRCVFANVTSCLSKRVMYEEVGIKDAAAKVARFF